MCNPGNTEVQAALAVQNQPRLQSEIQSQRTKKKENQTNRNYKKERIGINNTYSYKNVFSGIVIEKSDLF